MSAWRYTAVASAIASFAGLPCHCHGLLLAVGPIGMPPLPQQQDQHSLSTSDYGPKRNHPTAYDDNPPFKGPLQLSMTSSPDLYRQRIQRYYLDKSNSLQLPTYTADQQPPKLKTSASTSTIIKTIVDHLAYLDAPLDAKEVAESVEFYLRSAKRILGAAKRIAKSTQRASSSRCGGSNGDIVVLDLCSGHGLTGMLFAACNPPRSSAAPIRVRTVLVDRFEPPSHKQVKAVIGEVCPWIKDEESVQFVPSALDEYIGNEKTGASDERDSSSALASIVISTHACGSLTDDILRYAVDIGAASIASMPCCYTGTDKGAPYGIRRALGVGMAADVRRSFFLQDSDYHVDFATIPRAVTPMNRIIVAEKRTF